MGMCPPGTRRDDLIVMLEGSCVPFVVRPIRTEAVLKDEDWNFEGSDLLKDQTYRFIGECFVHGRMSSKYLEEHEDHFGPPEVFNLI